MIHYRLPMFETTDEFLGVLAKRFGKLKKQGLPDKDAAARKLLHDWNTGVIKYYTQPPETPEAQVGGASLIQELSAEFDLASIREDEGSLLKELPLLRPSKTMKFNSLGPVKEVMSEGYRDEESDMEDDDDDEAEEEEGPSALLGKEVCINLDPQPENKKAKEEEKKPRWETQVPTFDPETMSMQKFQKKMMKKARKEKNRNVKRIDSLVDELDTLKCANEDYDFDEHFE